MVRLPAGSWHGLPRTVEAGFNKVSGTFKIASLYAACVATEAPDITDLRHVTSLHPDCWL